MGYSRTWTGAFRIEPPLTEEDRASYRACVDAAAAPAPRGRCGWVPSAARVFVAGEDVRAQTQPSGWLEWDGAEGFAAGGEWLAWLVERFFAPRRYTLAGAVTWEGEEPGDAGTLSVEANLVREVAAEAEAASDAALAGWISELRIPPVALQLEALSLLETVAPTPAIVAAFADALLHDPSPPAPTPGTAWSPARAAGRRWCARPADQSSSSSAAPW